MTTDSRELPGWAHAPDPPEDLTRMRGPTRGTVRLPARIYSSALGPRTVFDLDDERYRRLVYEIVLAEGNTEDLCSYLNLAELRRLWPTLFLPRHVRQAWEPRLGELLAAGPS